MEFYIQAWIYGSPVRGIPVRGLEFDGIPVWNSIFRHGFMEVQWHSSPEAWSLMEFQCVILYSGMDLWKSSGIPVQRPGI